MCPTTATDHALMTPGAYLKKRREAAGLTIAEAARAAAAVAPIDGPQLERRIMTVEADEDIFGDATLATLLRAFRFSPGVYGNLVAGIAAGQVCRSCGCSEWDACLTLQGPCAWHAFDLCTRCAKTPTLATIVPEGEPCLQLRASDPFAVALTSILGALHAGQWSVAERYFRELMLRERNAFRFAAVGEGFADNLMRTADAMAEWRSTKLGPLPAGENVHV